MSKELGIQNDKFTNTFFTKKKLIWTVISTILIIAFIALVSRFVLDINFTQIGELFNLSFNNNNLFGLWFFLLILFPIYNTLFRIYVFWYKLRKDNIKVKWYDWLSFGLIGAFLNAITPFAIGNEPYTLFWLRSKGVSVKRATVIIASNGILNPIIQVLITWPSFFIISSTYSQFSGDIGFQTAFWFGFVGLIGDLIALVFYWTVSYSKWVHSRINLLWHWTRKKLKLSYKTKDEILTEFVTKATFQKEFLAELKDTKTLAILVFGNLIWNFLLYFSMIFSFQLLNPNLEIDFFQIFNYTNVAVTANNFIPIPNGEGTLQLVLSAFIRQGAITVNGVPVPPADIDPFLNSVIFIWRLFTSYSLSILGMISFPVSALIFYKNRHKFKSREDESFTVIIPSYNSKDYIEKALNSLINSDYNKSLLQVLVIDDGSTDDSFKIAKSVASNHSYIECYTKPNGQWGSVINYVKNQKLAKNNYVSILDADDFYDVNAFKNLNDINDDYDIIAGAFRKYNGQTKRRKVNPYWYVFKSRIWAKNQMMSPYCCPLHYFVKKDIFYKVNDLTEKMAYQDPDYLAQISYNAKMLKFTRHVIGYYYFNRPNNSVSQSWTEQRYQAELNACRKCIQYDAQEIVSYRINIKEMRENLKKHNDYFEVERPFNFLWFPVHLRWIYKIIHNKKNGKFFKYKKQKDKSDNTK